MKKTISKISIFMFLCCTSFFAKAQIEKGMKVFSTTASFSTTHSSNHDSTAFVNNSDNKSLNFSVGPKIGYFVSDKICIGISGLLSYSKTDVSGNTISSSFYSTSTTKDRSYSYGISPYLRYYKKFTNNFYAFLNTSANFVLGNSNNQYSSTGNNIDIQKVSNYRCYAGFGFGLTYFVSPKFAVETTIAAANVGYNWSKTSEKTDEYYSQKTAGVYTNVAPNGFNLGVSYYFR